MNRPLALITGASRGIGAATAETLAATHDLLLGGRDAAALDAVCDRLDGARAWPVDLTDPQALARACAGIERLDVLVHNAGRVDLGSIAETSVELWRRTFDLNLFAVVELTRLLLPALRAASGDVVFINSGSGLRANPRWACYAAGKFALRAFADSLRLEEPGLRVTSIHPGRTATDMQREVRSFEGGDYDPRDYLRPESVAHAVATAVLATPDAHIHEITLRQR